MALLQEIEELQEQLGKEETWKKENRENPCKSNNHVKRDLKCNYDNNSAEEELVIGVKIGGSSGEEEDVPSKRCRPAKKHKDISSKFIALSDKSMVGFYPHSQSPGYQIGVQFSQYNPWYRMSYPILSYRM